jgi:hypothetical protein
MVHRKNEREHTSAMFFAAGGAARAYQWALSVTPRVRGSRDDDRQSSRFA